MPRSPVAEKTPLKFSWKTEVARKMDGRYVRVAIFNLLYRTKGFAKGKGFLCLIESQWNTSGRISLIQCYHQLIAPLYSFWFPVVPFPADSG